MNRLIGYLAALMPILGLLGGCATLPNLDSGTVGPPLSLEAFFAGETEGEGKFVNSWTGSERLFRVRIAGTWDGQTLVLVEDFAYADGEKDRKTWHLRQTGNGTFTGTREDVVGEARVWTDGKAVRLAYSVKLGGLIVDFNDILALRDDGSLLNRATVGKWNIRLGRVELMLHKVAG